MTAFLPKVGEAMVENTGQPRPSYRRWMQQVTEAVNAPATPPGPDPEPPTPPVSFVINGSGSVTADGSIAGGEFVIGLDNDKDEPGNTKYYGTDSSGNRGFVALSEGLEAGTSIALTDSGYTMLPSVATPADLPLTGNAGEAVRVTDEAPGVYAWDGSAFTLDEAATGKVGIALIDAPSDGSIYGRQDGAWVSIASVSALSIASGVVNIDLSLGSNFTLSLTDNVTSVTFSNLPVAGHVAEIEVQLTQDATGGRTVALPAAFKALGGSDTAVASAANAVTILSAKTFDQGTTWRYAMQESA